MVETHLDLPEGGQNSPKVSGQSDWPPVIFANGPFWKVRSRATSPDISEISPPYLVSCSILLCKIDPDMAGFDYCRVRSLIGASAPIENRMDYIY